MANPKASDRERGRRRVLNGRAGGLDKSRGDIEVVQLPTPEEGSGGRDDLEEAGAMAKRRVVREKRMPTPSVARSGSPTSTRDSHHRHRSSRRRLATEERHHRRRRSSKDDDYEPPVHVYGPPRSGKRPSRIRYSEVRVLGRSGSHSSSGEEEPMSVVSEEEAASPRQEDADETQTKAQEPREHRRRRRLTEEESAARRAAREARESTMSIHRSKTSSPRKELLQPLDFLRG